MRLFENALKGYSLFVEAQKLLKHIVNSETH